MHGRRTFAALTVTALLAVGAAACGDDGEADRGATRGAPASARVELSPQSGSGLAGTAELVEEGEGRTRVTIDLEQPEAGQSRPAHVHQGTCSDLDPAPAHGLANVEEGTSETLIDASLEELRAGGYAINLHRSADDLETYVACGDIG